jgi:acyl carrier protein
MWVRFPPGTPTNKVKTTIQTLDAIETVQAVCSKRLGQDFRTERDLETPLEELGADSLTMLEIVMALEEKTGTNLPDELHEEPSLTMRKLAEALERASK